MISETLHLPIYIEKCIIKNLGLNFAQNFNGIWQFQNGILT